ncbi:PilZ domain-containing protein [Tolumonas lignilytica]|uniref:PilZ domain-containing protein n=1 Tax=Tolumonas lignilytica TaxID=1283284 RepID=UPI0004679DA4|nr:PilZ domain-containing protein [Tolumonas lignilytica]
MSEQYFSVQHCLSISVIPLEQDFKLPDLASFEAEIPEPFKISNTLVQLDLSNARALRQISDDIGYLVEVINQQSRKINLLMAHILQQDDNPLHRHQTHSFGGSQLTFHTSLPLEKGQLLRLKIFLREEACAVYCYGRVTHIEGEEERLLVTATYELLRNEDRELLIRACSHEQSRQLRERAEKKYQLT